MDALIIGVVTGLALMTLAVWIEMRGQPAAPATENARTSVPPRLIKR